MREQNFVTEASSQTGILCSLTQRVMIISPLPDRVRSLLVALSTDCFDVFSLHEFNKGMLPALQPELLVYDALPLPLPSVGHTLEGGAELLAAARDYNVPVLVLLDATSYEEHSGHALSGAELLQWPAQPEEALDRIHRMLEDRPAQPSGNAEDVRVFKDIRIDLRKMKVERGGARVELTKTEYDLLLYFIHSDGSVLTREMLLDNVWGSQFYGGSNVVDVHIKTLRKKLKDSAVSPRYIVTVRGAGYRLADDAIH
ncbi:DNA-binding response regulator [Paenibacillus sp. 1011MAR3C5]|uniref:response regulator transcription factor n=1 Tax=Paenibacillus sp. 1011MAR3C5 TaxID=1675787 RepID=UPI000E6BEECB|nr:response regulator transcription factor [Paenibacillus sp. 1011MAR3C5]RJE86037.1 DNA-binding response regulator [Paenibacillus sp. 1011MAR3C5]